MAFSPDLDLERHKKVFEEFVEQHVSVTSERAQDAGSSRMQSTQFYTSGSSKHASARVSQAAMHFITWFNRSLVVASFEFNGRSLGT